MSFPRPTQMFQFRRFPSYTYFIQYMIPYGGFPHSEISGSQLICSSPKLIAAYHVLHRLLMPRHSPCALISLIYFQINYYKKSPFGSLLVELCRLKFRSFYLAKIVFYPIIKIFPLCCLLIIASQLINVQFSRYILNLFFKKLNEDSDHSASSVNFLWWRVPGSNR